MLTRSLPRCHFTFPIPKQLNEVARVPLLKQETAVRIRELWLEQFKARQDVVVGSLARTEFETFKANATACPMFIVPVMKGEAAYFNLISQFQDGKHCLFTSLDSFKESPHSASPMMVSTVYDELVAEKGIALLRGDIINRLEISRQEAQKILKFIRHMYINKFELVKRFNLEPRSFDYNEFMNCYRTFSVDQAGNSNRL
jgi:ATP synthase F1 complex assembly factor 1